MSNNGMGCTKNSAPLIFRKGIMGYINETYSKEQVAKLAQFARAQQNAASIELSHLLDSFEAELKAGGFNNFSAGTLHLLVHYCDDIIMAANKYMSADDDLLETEIYEKEAAEKQEKK